MKNKTELRQAIVGSFLNNRNEVYRENYTRENFFKEIFRFYVLISNLNVASDSTILLVGQASSSWIAVYFAAILRGINIMILPHGMTENEISWYANRYLAHTIFISESDKHLFESADSFRNILFTKSVFALWNYSFIKCRTGIANDIIGLDTIINSTEIDFKYAAQTIYEDVSNLRFSSMVYSLTSGVESAYPKVITNTTDTLWEAVNAFDLDLEDMEVRMHNPEKFHVWSILYPTLKNVEVYDDGALFKANVMFDSHAFKAFWNNVIAQNYPVGLNKIKFFRNRAIQRTISHYLDSVIIVNADIPSEWVKLLSKSCNLVTTYGLEETNHLVTYNNYHNKALRRKNCVGVVCNSDIEVHDNGSIVAPHLFHSYAWDQEATRLLKPRHNLIMTNDKLKTKLIKGKPYVFLNGRDMDFTDRIAYGRVEKEINASPYVNTCVIASHPNDENMKVLLIEPNIGYCEIQGLGLEGLKALFLDMLGRLNGQLGKELLSDVIVEPNSIETTYDGKIKTYYYR
jgi:hypothetical protein